MAAVAVGDHPALGNAQKRIVRLVILARSEERFVRCDKRRAAPISQIDERQLGQSRGRHAVALQLDVEAITEQALQFLAARERKCALSGGDSRVERTVRSAAERDQAAGIVGEPGKLNVRLLRLLGIEVGTRAKPHQAPVAMLARSEEYDPRKALPHRHGAVVPIAEINAERAADNRLDAGACHFLGEFERPEHVVGVGQRQRRLAVLLCELRQARDRQRAFEQGIGGMDVQMHETGGRGGHIVTYSRETILRGVRMRLGPPRCP